MMNDKMREELSEDVLEIEFLTLMLRRRLESASEKFESHSSSDEHSKKFVAGARARIAIFHKLSRDIYFGIVKASDAKDPFPEDICEKCGQRIHDSSN